MSGGRATQGQGVMPDGTSHFSYQGKPILHYMGCSTFSNYTLAEISLARSGRDAPLIRFANRLWGNHRYWCSGLYHERRSWLYSGCIWPWRDRPECDSGPNGGATRIIGIDLNPAREALGKQFGMTDFINPKDVDNLVDILLK